MGHEVDGTEPIKLMRSLTSRNNVHLKFNFFNSVTPLDSRRKYDENEKKREKNICVVRIITYK